MLTLEYVKTVEKVPLRRGCLGGKEFAQFSTQNLAGWGPRKGIDKMDLTGLLVGSQPLGDKST